MCVAAPLGCGRQPESEPELGWKVIPVQAGGEKGAAVAIS